MLDALARRSREGLQMLAALLLSASLTTTATAQTLVVSPAADSVPVGSSRQLVAYANGAVTSAVTWSVNGIPGGNTTFGKIDGTGKFAAPAAPPAGWTVTVTATSTTSPGASANAAITVRNQIPWLTTLTPNPMPIGSFTLQVAGSRFVNGAEIKWNGAALPTTFKSSTLLVASGVASQPGPVNITVVNPGPGAVSTAMVLQVTTGITVGVAPTSVTLQASTAQQFQATVSNHANQGVIWKVNNIAGGDSTTGTITTTGLYTAPLTAPLAGAVTVSAGSVVDGSKQGTAIVSIQDPLAITRGRFLDQATFGATQALTSHLAEVGIAAFLDEQFAMPESPWPALATATRANAIDAFFGNALNGQDQLRQRVVYALSEIIVIAMNKNTNGNEIVPWLQLLSRNAFGNYRTLLKEITLDASMGKYLDLANSGVMGGAANENYPREVMQLFSIGLYQLNLDGSVQTNAQNVPLLAYTQADVQELSKALTGWTYGNSTGIPPASGRYSYYPGPMLPIASRHNPTAKTILGHSLPAHQSIQEDLDDAIDILFQHPNVGPFLAPRLIRALVTSNPSPDYIARIASVFNDNGTGVRGDMKAVVRAILLDPEARNDNPAANFGRLRTPMQHTIALARALGLPLGAASQFAYLFYEMHEGMLDAASVFGHYSPTYRIPKTSLIGPEFQIYSASDAVNRGNFFYSLMFNPWPINPVLKPFVALATDPATLVKAVDNALLYGRMTPSTRTALLTAIPAMPDHNARALTALYLTAMSGEHLVQR